VHATQSSERWIERALLSFEQHRGDAPKSWVPLNFFRFVGFRRGGFHGCRVPELIDVLERTTGGTFVLVDCTGSSFGLSCSNRGRLSRSDSLAGSASRPGTLAQRSKFAGDIDDEEVLSLASRSGPMRVAGPLSKYHSQVSSSNASFGLSVRQTSVPETRFAGDTRRT